MPEGTDLVHYWHDNGDVASPWRRGKTISTAATGPASIIQSDFKGEHGNFEVVVLEGHSLIHYWHDNGDVASPWRRGKQSRQPRRARQVLSRATSKVSTATLRSSCGRATTLSITGTTIVTLAPPGGAAKRSRKQPEVQQ